LSTGASYAGSATWNLSPASNDWNTATNWTPATVPNGPSDVANFAVSNTTNITCSAGVGLDSIVFGPGASAFTITAPFETFAFSGLGIVNNSTVTQTFLVPSDAILYFTNIATAGPLTQMVAQSGGSPGYIIFDQNSSAGQGSYIVEGGTL